MGLEANVADQPRELESGSLGRPGKATPGTFSYSLMTTPLRITV